MARRGKTHRLTPARYCLTYGPNEPAMCIQPGDSVIVNTVDAGGLDEHGRKVPASMLESRPDTELCPSNPLVGPIHVEDAGPLDTLVVEIRRIRLNRPTAWSAFNPGFGFFTGETPGRRMALTPDIQSRRFEWKLDLKRKAGALALKRSRVKRLTIPLDPFIGSIGVAPRYGRVETALTPGEYGGNMDCVETRQGTTLYLPVFVRGALLGFGDVHAAQGDGEICGVALETTAEVTLRLGLIKGRALDWPRLEDRAWLMTAGSARPLMDAFRLAHYEMVKWLVDEYGFEQSEAVQALSQVGRARVGNVCDPNYTVLAKFPKKHLV